MSDEQRCAVLEEAMSWLRTPYHHAARLKGIGVDCAMFLAEVYEKAGVIDHVDPDRYPRDWHQHQSEELYLENVESFCHRVDKPKPGDVVMFKFGRCASHGAIVIEWPQIIHSYIDQGVILDDAKKNKRLEGKIIGFWSPWED